MLYIKHLAADNGFLRRGASKESSTIAPTLEVVFNTYMESVPRQRQTVSPGREIYDSTYLEFIGESYIKTTVARFR